MEFELRRKAFQPVTVGSDETTALFSIQRGERVLWASFKPVVAAAAGTTSTITLGDGSDVDGYVTTSDYDPETATVATALAGAGNYLANSGGKLYTVDDTIDAVYTANGATGAKPKAEFCVCVTREWNA